MVTLESQGNKIELSISMKGLYLLRQKDPEAYERYYDAQNTIGNGKSTILFDAMQICYTGYLCNLLKTGGYDDRLSLEDFLDYLPEGTTESINIVRELTNPKKA